MHAHIHTHTHTHLLLVWHLCDVLPWDHEGIGWSQTRLVDGKKPGWVAVGRDRDLPLRHLGPGGEHTEEQVRKNSLKL